MSQIGFPDHGFLLGSITHLCLVGAFRNSVYKLFFIASVIAKCRFRMLEGVWNWKWRHQSNEWLWFSIRISQIYRLSSTARHYRRTLEGAGDRKWRHYSISWTKFCLGGPLKCFAYLLPFKSNLVKLFGIWGATNIVFLRILDHKWSLVKSKPKRISLSQTASLSHRTWNSVSSLAFRTFEKR